MFLFDSHLIGSVGFDFAEEKYLLAGHYNVLTPTSWEVLRRNDDPTHAKVFRRIFCNIELYMRWNSLDPNVVLVGEDCSMWRVPETTENEIKKHTLVKRHIKSIRGFAKIMWPHITQTEGPETKVLEFEDFVPVFTAAVELAANPEPAVAVGGHGGSQSEIQTVAEGENGQPDEGSHAMDLDVADSNREDLTSKIANVSITPVENGAGPGPAAAVGGNGSAPSEMQTFGEGEKGQPDEGDHAMDLDDDDSNRDGTKGQEGEGDSKISQSAWRDLSPDEVNEINDLLPNSRRRGSNPSFLNCVLCYVHTPGCTWDSLILQVYGNVQSHRKRWSAMKDQQHLVLGWYKKRDKVDASRVNKGVRDLTELLGRHKPSDQEESGLDKAAIQELVGTLCDLRGMADIDQLSKTAELVEALNKRYTDIFVAFQADVAAINATMSGSA